MALQRSHDQGVIRLRRTLLRNHYGQCPDAAMIRRATISEDMSALHLTSFMLVCADIRYPIIPF